jgi:hypothetical protein
MKFIFPWIYILYIYINWGRYTSLKNTMHCCFCSLFANESGISNVD